jgi:PEP-CTERM motif
MTRHVSTAALAAALCLSLTGAASAGTLFFDLGPSTENFTLYGIGPVSVGIGGFTVGQGSGVFDSTTDTSTFTLSGSITGGSPGFDSGTYAFVTTYSGADTPMGGPHSPYAQSNPSNTNEFFYDLLDPSTTMTLDLFGTPTGDHAISLVVGGNFVAGTSFGFTYTSTSCDGSPPSCTQNNVGLTPGASIFGPVTISASITTAVPEPSTWAMMLIGFSSVALAGYCSAKKRNGLSASV